MMTVETCNGWANRETWSLMLWVNNDAGLYVRSREWLEGELTRDPWDLADAMRGWAESMFTRAGYVDTYGAPWPDEIADIALEIGSLDRVDWMECVEHLADSLA